MGNLSGAAHNKSAPTHVAAATALDAFKKLLRDAMLICSLSVRLPTQPLIFFFAPYHADRLMPARCVRLAILTPRPCLCPQAGKKLELFVLPFVYVG